MWRQAITILSFLAVVLLFSFFVARENMNTQKLQEEYLISNPYLYDVNDYVSYLGIVGVVLDRDVEGAIIDEMYKRYDVEFPASVGNGSNSPFRSWWCHEDALRKRNYK